MGGREGGREVDGWVETEGERERERRGCSKEREETENVPKGEK